MNNFNGIIAEFPSLMVDKFNGSIGKDVIFFFLSHCHSDHMVGLEDEKIHEYLKSRKDVFVYCSEISRRLLINDQKYQHLENFIKSLEIDCPTKLLDDYNGRNFLVTLLPACHCPGSVMFLFETCERCVLYTGDFRMSADTLALYANLKLKTIDTLYCDTTFCIPEASYIPHREDSLSAIIEIISGWFKDGKESRCVNIICSAMIGYENVFIEVSKRFKTKIRVSRKMLKKYEEIAELKNVVTCENSRIRAFYKKDRIYNGDEPFEEILKIKLSAMWFTQHKSIHDIIYESKKLYNYYRVCYSMHSSFSEIVQFVAYLNPSTIVPLVIPINSSANQIRDLLKSKCKSKNSSLSHDLGNLKRKQTDYNMLSSCDSLSFNANMSPEKKLRGLEPAYSTNEKSIQSSSYNSSYLDEKSFSSPKLLEESKSSSQQSTKSENSLVWQYPSSDSEKIVSFTTKSPLMDKHFVSPPSSSKYENRSPELFDSDDSNEKFDADLRYNEDEKCIAKCDFDDNDLPDSDVTPSLPSSIESSQRYLNSSLHCNSKPVVLINLESSQSFPEEFPVITLSP